MSNIARTQINYLVIILCVAILIITFLLNKKLEIIQVYGIVIILFIIIGSTLYTLCNDNPETFINYNKTRECHNRNKEYLDYKDKIYNRVDDLKDIEESDRKEMEYEDEINKVIEMGDLNLDYLANGETF
jgi:hypothetical protein